MIPTPPPTQTHHPCSEFKNAITFDLLYQFPLEKRVMFSITWRRQVGLLMKLVYVLFEQESVLTPTIKYFVRHHELTVMSVLYP